MASGKMTRPELRFFASSSRQISGRLIGNDFILVRIDIAERRHLGARVLDGRFHIAGPFGQFQHVDLLRVHDALAIAYPDKKIQIVFQRLITHNHRA